MKIEVKEEHLPIIKQKFGYEVAEFCKKIVGLKIDRKAFQKKIQFHFENSYCNALANRVKTNEFLFDLYSIIKVDLYDEIVEYVRSQTDNFQRFSGQRIDNSLEYEICLLTYNINEYIKKYYGVDINFVDFDLNVKLGSLYFSCLLREEFQQKMLYRNFL